MLISVLRVVNKYIVCFLGSAHLAIGSIIPFCMLNAEVSFFS